MKKRKEQPPQQHNNINSSHVTATFLCEGRQTTAKIDRAPRGRQHVFFSIANVARLSFRRVVLEKVTSHITTFLEMPAASTDVTRPSTASQRRGGAGRVEQCLAKLGPHSFGMKSISSCHSRHGCRTALADSFPVPLALIVGRTNSIGAKAATCANDTNTSNSLTCRTKRGHEKPQREFTAWVDVPLRFIGFDKTELCGQLSDFLRSLTKGRHFFAPVAHERKNGDRYLFCVVPIPFCVVF